MQLLNHHRQPCDVLSYGLAIMTLTSVLLQSVRAEYDCSAKDDGWYYDPDFCHIYWRCIHGTAEEFECASGTAWDHHENRCNWLDSVDCLRAEKTTAAVDDEESTSGYDYSGDGDDVFDRPTVVKPPKKPSKPSKKPPKPPKFGPKKNPSNGDGTDDAETKDHTTTATKRSDSESSPSDSNVLSAAAGTNGKDGGASVIECQPTGIYPVQDPAECNAYYQCTEGIRTRIICAEKTFYDVDKQKCVDFERVVCGTRAVNAADKNQCTNKRDGVYPDTERNCHYYYQCKSQSKSREGKCAGDLMFNLYTGRCGSASNVPIPCGSYIPGSTAAKSHLSVGILSVLMLLVVAAQFQCIAS